MNIRNLSGLLLGSTMLALCPSEALSAIAVVELFGVIEGVPDAEVGSGSGEEMLLTGNHNSKGDIWIHVYSYEDQVFSVIFRDKDGYRTGGYALGPNAHTFPIPPGMDAFLRDEEDDDSLGISGGWWDVTGDMP